MRRDNQLIVLTHLSQLVTLVTAGIGSLVVPLVLWLIYRDRVYEMDAHGKEILNFQLSIFLYMILCVPLILLLGLGIVGIIVLGLLSVIFPIINAIKASNGEVPKYPLSLNFIS